MWSDLSQVSGKKWHLRGPDIAFSRRVPKRSGKGTVRRRYVAGEDQRWDFWVKGQLAAREVWAWSRLPGRQSWELWRQGRVTVGLEGSFC